MKIKKLKYENTNVNMQSLTCNIFIKFIVLFSITP